MAFIAVSPSQRPHAELASENLRTQFLCKCVLPVTSSVADFLQAIPDDTPEQTPEDDDKVSPLLILYGTQDGNAESIAEELRDRAIAHGIASSSVVLSALNDFKRLDLFHKERVIIVCATTGNGEAPRTADVFVRYLRNR